MLQAMVYPGEETRHFWWDRSLQWESLRGSSGLGEMSAAKVVGIAALGITGIAAVLFVVAHLRG